jgi:elongation factor P
MVEAAPIETIESQYLYRENENLIFMNPRNYNQYSLALERIGNFFKLMKEGEIYQLLVLEDKAVALRLPLKVRLKVTHAESGARGNTVTGATKEVEVETGYKLQVPLFIKEGETIAINVEGGSYVERA